MPMNTSDSYQNIRDAERALIETAPDKHLARAALDMHLRERLAAYKRPSRIITIDTCP